jgi:hypothetical protein
MNTTQAAKAFIQAKEALEQAEKAKAQAEAILKEAYAKAGVSFEVVDDVKVAVIEAERASYDAEALAEMVSSAVYKMVTKPSVDSKKFRSAVELGKIKQDVADAVTSVTPYTTVRVNPLSADAKAESRQALVA